MPGAVNWDVAPSGNDVCDPPIIFNEGQPAKTINDAARALMASVALWILDVAGLNAAYGADDYTVITSQTHADAVGNKVHTFAFTPQATNLNPCRLRPDALPLRPWLRADGTEFGPGDIVPGTVFRVAYDPAAQVYRTVSPTTVAAGTIQAFGGPNLPPGWERCDGRAVSRTAYKALYAAVSDTWGHGDGFSTFNLPDMRGRAPFGANFGLGVLSGAGGLVGALGYTGGAETVALLPPQMPSHVHTARTAAAGGYQPTMDLAGQHDHGATTGPGGDHNHGGSTDGAGGHSHGGSTSQSGQHSHHLQYQRSATSTATPNNAVSLTAFYPDGSPNSGGQTDPEGQHQHSFTTDTAANHAHPFTTDTATAHNHPIVADGNHRHPMAAVLDHTHAVTVDAAGSGDPHPNVPPGAVVHWAIKT